VETREANFGRAFVRYAVSSIERLRVGAEAKLEDQRVRLGDKVERVGAGEDTQEGELVRGEGQGEHEVLIGIRGNEGNPSGGWAGRR